MISRKFQAVSLLLFHVLFLSFSAKADVMIGAYVPYDGWSSTQIQLFKDESNKDPAFINLFSTFSHRWDWHLQHQSNNIFNKGARPMISFMPVDTSRSGVNILTEITAGTWDTYLTSWANGLITWVNSKAGQGGTSVMIRFGHEFNGNWYSYGNDPVNFVLAWQHIHDLFDTLGANDHIQWVWAANYVDVDDWDDMTLYYPGDAYVDWTGLDGYNWGSNYSFSTWKSFSNVFASSYNLLVTNYPDKPIMLAEVSSANPGDTPRASYGQDGDNSDSAEDKDVWVTDMLTDLPVSFPAVRAICLFNYNKELGWSLYGVTSQGVANTGITGWNSLINDPYYTSTFLIVD